MRGHLQAPGRFTPGGAAPCTHWIAPNVGLEAMESGLWLRQESDTNSLLFLHVAWILYWLDVPTNFILKAAP
jgi:hypothetical protein